MHQRLPNIGIDMARQRREPGLDRVDGLADAGEAEAVYDALDGANLVLDRSPPAIGDGDRRGQIAEGDVVAAGRRTV